MKNHYFWGDRSLCIMIIDHDPERALTSKSNARPLTNVVQFMIIDHEYEQLMLKENSLETTPRTFPILSTELQNGHHKTGWRIHLLIINHWTASTGLLLKLTRTLLTKEPKLHRLQGSYKRFRSYKVSKLTCQPSGERGKWPTGT